jgi:hypothetical protein
MKFNKVLLLSIMALASCGPRHQRQEPATNGNSPVLPEPSAPPAVTNREAPPLKPARSVPTVDPKSTEAAVELVQSFVNLLNQGKFNEAYMLLGPNAVPRSEFDRSWTLVDHRKVSVGTPGQQEGAAGSIYLSVPLHLSGTSNGRPIDRSATAIVRRVNDVPGSTEAQRHWHIERIDWGQGA